jgi:hypothetical protein
MSDKENKIKTTANARTRIYRNSCRAIPNGVPLASGQTKNRTECKDPVANSGVLGMNYKEGTTVSLHTVLLS